MFIILNGFNLRNIDIQSDFEKFSEANTKICDLLNDKVQWTNKQTCEKLKSL